MCAAVGGCYVPATAMLADAAMKDPRFIIIYRTDNE
jgi:hypothetical protein